MPGKKPKRGKREEPSKLLLTHHFTALPKGLWSINRLKKEIRKGAKYYVVEIGREPLEHYLKEGIGSVNFLHPVFMRFTVEYAREKGLKLIPAEGGGKGQERSELLAFDPNIPKADVTAMLKKKKIPASHLMKYFDGLALGLALRNIDMVEALSKHYSKPGALDKTTGFLGEGHAIVLDLVAERIGKPVPHLTKGRNYADFRPVFKLANKITRAYYHPEEGISERWIENRAVGNSVRNSKVMKAYSRLREKDPELKELHSRILKLISKGHSLERKIRVVKAGKPKTRIYSDVRMYSAAISTYYSALHGVKLERKENKGKLKRHVSFIKKRVKELQAKA